MYPRSHFTPLDPAEHQIVGSTCVACMRSQVWLLTSPLNVILPCRKAPASEAFGKQHQLEQTELGLRDQWSVGLYGAVSGERLLQGDCQPNPVGFSTAGSEAMEHVPAMVEVVLQLQMTLRKHMELCTSGPPPESLEWPYI